MKERFKRKWSKCGVVLTEEFIYSGSMMGRLQRKWSQTGVVLTIEWWSSAKKGGPYRIINFYGSIKNRFQRKRSEGGVVLTRKMVVLSEELFHMEVKWNGFRDCGLKEVLGEEFTYMAV